MVITNQVPAFDHPTEDDPTQFIPSQGGSHVHFTKS